MGELATCRYSHGKCKLPRATKKNGTLHTLCEYHRTKACAHQKKLDAKRRNEKLKLFQDDPSLRPHGRKLMGKPLSPIVATGSWHDIHETENRAPLPTRQFNWDHHPSPPPLSPSFLKPLPATAHYQPSSQVHHYVQAYPTYDPSPRDVYQGNEYDENRRYHFFNGRREYYAPSPPQAQYNEPLRADLISPRAAYDYYEPNHEAEPAYARWGSQPVAYHS
ncbi:hypothetical protein SPRG_08916 [Saprolegnia parasitica CBS 223.65]|uniref:Uncharacterized protein n=1 Tax=Saprolegnia parasitica (strain CBS 223.65) TaxID=695850 RepID=A0A067CFN7_SAPPC|nr:hypothetical protein SPRG_08916 [Saprolegnia parasitica CBS 223.65]KDO25617.1 hypothetical protein SPRG_08916 [Saprolegnia parasitica CBS 223.65]|eukprot:XP_012203650.1 hypothetical protein SPRG_08916 [Saprolegnia parasitica CBS 223.65]